MGELGAFIPLAILLSITPGASTALLVRAVLRGGPRGAAASIAGNSCGLIVWAVAGAFGLSALVAASQLAYDGLRLAGAVVLIVLGVLTLRRSTRPLEIEGPVTAGTFRAGLVTNLANPKAAVFFIALLPQFVPEGAPVLPWMLGLAAIQIAIDIAWYSTVTWFVLRARAVMAGERVRRAMERVTGAILVGLGLRLATE